MKTIIAGCRDYYIYTTVCKAIEQSGFEITEVVSGGANGVDALGERWACEHQMIPKVFPADWSKYGKAAGPVRNRQMAEYADALIAIWDSKSKGTKNMIETAMSLQLRVFVFRIDRQVLDTKQLGLKALYDPD